MRALETLKAQFQSYVWQHVLSIIIGLMLVKGVKTLSALVGEESVATLSRTLSKYEWPLEAVRELRCQQITKALHKRYNKRRGRRPVIYLILDDTVLPKRGKRLPALGYHYSATLDAVVRGHDLVFSAVRIGSLCTPWDWKPYLNERFVEEESFRKRTEMAVEMVRGFEPPFESRVIVVVDSTYCCARLIETAVKRWFTLIGLVKKDRLLADGRKAWEVPEGTVAALNGMEIPVQIVHRGRGKGRRTVICTDLELGRQQILWHMKRRWGIEVMFKMLKAHFSLGECRCRSEEGFERWIELVLLSYVLAGLTRWGKHMIGEEPTWGEVRQEWGWRLISVEREVLSWLARLWRLIYSWLILFSFSPLSSPNLELEVA